MSETHSTTACNASLTCQNQERVELEGWANQLAFRVTEINLHVSESESES